MCGIVGYIGAREKKGVLISGLKELEYRGYDSAGLSVLKNDDPKNGNLQNGSPQNGTLATFKTTGKLINLENKCKNFESGGFGVGIAHTRWATHGRANEINAHPHATETTSVVHNGIIENHAVLRAALEKRGRVFLSQTDTEVILHLFEENLAQDSPKDSRLDSQKKSSPDSPLDSRHALALAAFKKTIDSLVGSYAILLISASAPGAIFYAKNGSPLLIARNVDEKLGEEIYFASSPAPLFGLVREVCYLKDGEVGVMNLGGFEALANIVPMGGEKLSTQKDGFRFFMEKEIYEQNEVLKNTIAGRIEGDSLALELPLDFLQSVEEITICACGTSYHAGLVAKYIFEREAGVKTSAVNASEYRYAAPIMRGGELFVVISQSGETADTLQALKLAKKNGLKTLAICNVENSSITREADFSLLTRVGIEKGVASTKAFSSQVLLLWMLGIFIAQSRGKLGESAIQAQISQMKDAIAATKITPALHDRLKKLSKRYLPESRLHGHGFFFIGRDIFYPLALEGALKLKEISYIHAEGYPGGEIKHGPIALADSGLFCISLMPKHLLYDKIKNNTAELASRDATICVISQEPSDLADDFVLLPPLKSPMEEFFAMMIVLQILALEVALRLGNDVDMPRNLAKSVTVE